METGKPSNPCKGAFREILSFPHKSSRECDARRLFPGGVAYRTGMYGNGKRPLFPLDFSECPVRERPIGGR
jgi:hypothetical protein